MLYQWTLFVGELVCKIFTDGMVISRRWKNFVSKIVKCYSAYNMKYIRPKIIETINLNLIKCSHEVGSKPIFLLSMYYDCPLL
jgi:hypothetical protein